ncbi:SNF2-related domain-containing protein [Rozella allomycis CSF55]|uniref:SNF2-related domain-containing protein n=1 Tax=Rozella allomycis (strain CSF55) TaxID=988480 RepID=A0A075AUI7_ROZAC|nr:SNF2-related domain-containing protein [Rozella allomycis CSF55]|eukprot:EPZ32387.1 SNF2-related domain-containing protein [Rozella allomycis CSF55]
MTSRLDRLVLLLDSGSTQGIRESAARNLGDIQREYPEEFGYLIRRVKRFLRSKSGETRWAAAVAVREIVRNVCGEDYDVEDEENKDEKVQDENEGRLTFEAYDLERVLNDGKLLVASSGDEYDQDVSELTADLKEQRKMMMQRLGLGAQFMESLVEESDFVKVEEDEERVEMEGLSARERNRLKRMKKNKKRVNAEELMKVGKKAKTEEGEGEMKGEDGEWKFQRLCEEFCVEIFDTNWNVRHGAVLGLSEIIREHGRDGGKRKGLSKEKNEEKHERWSVDVGLRLVSLLALDRFADYIDDSISVPVRETGGQCLGLLMRCVSDENVKRIMGLLVELSENEHWEVRLSGLLGIKYILGVRRDLFSELKPIVYGVIIEALKSEEDDIKKAGAESMYAIVEYLKDEKEQVMNILSDNMKELDDLTCSTESIMRLLSKLVTLSEMGGEIVTTTTATATTSPCQPPITSTTPPSNPSNPSLYLNKFLPNMFQFFRHSIIGVRMSVLESIEGMMNTLTIKEVERELMNELIEKLIENSLKEENKMILDKSLDLMKKIKKFEIEIEKIEKFIERVLIQVENEVEMDIRVFGEDVLIRNRIYSFKMISVLINESNYNKIIKFLSLIEKKNLNFYLLNYFMEVKGEADGENGENGEEKGEVTGEGEVHGEGKGEGEVNGEVNGNVSDQLQPLQPQLPQPQLPQLYREVAVEVAVKVKNDVNLALNQVVRPLMFCLRREENKEILEIVSNSIVKVFKKFKKEKIIKNLIEMKNEASRNVLKLIVREFGNNLHEISIFNQIISLEGLEVEKGVEKAEEKKEGEPTTSIETTTSTSIETTSTVNTTTTIETSTPTTTNSPTQPTPTLTTSPFSLLEVLEVVSGELDNVYLNKIPIEKIINLIKNRNENAIKIFINLLKRDEKYFRDLKDLIKEIYEFKFGILDLIELILKENILIDSISNEIIIPILSLMSDSNKEIRNKSCFCFGELIQIILLNKNRNINNDFIDCLLDNKKIKNYEIPTEINATLRKYQQEGVNWLLFLQEYGLHGALCDDMGLGKTLQTICAVSAVQFKNNKIPSLVVCPPSLIGHWENEIKSFSSFLKPLQFHSKNKKDWPLNQSTSNYNVFICSFDFLRNNLHYFKKFNYNYFILDEGHVIKNPKTKISLAVKSIVAKHRLVLTGTPIQNNILELWSIFDFLMPGFLGSEQEFNEKYVKPIKMKINENKMGDRVKSEVRVKGESDVKIKGEVKMNEAGVIALDGLHRQMLPFMLRRIKDQVLNDLPPKIMQDYYCSLSKIQSKIYEQIELDEIHVFQSLQELRRLITHPLLLKDERIEGEKGEVSGKGEVVKGEEVKVKGKGKSKATKDVKNAKVVKGVKGVKDVKEVKMETNSLPTSVPSNSSLMSQLEVSGKFVALKQLLIDCGISPDNNLSPHRILIFVQLKSTLDLIENILFKPHFPFISYLRLDGSVDSTKRIDIVSKFNSDPSIDCLILTTQVGGLGLNLTGADTVIFMEHDWNPMKDLQAMDRAHRIGQKKVVNVYRLICKDTLEEKILNLQKFKLAVANSVVNEQNSSTSSMNTSELIDLFKKENNKKVVNKNKKLSLNQLLEELENEQDQEQDYSVTTADEFFNSIK